MEGYYPPENKKKLKEMQINHVAELNGKCVVTDMVWSEHAAYQFCSVL
jgi:hypothetical protein